MFDVNHRNTRARCEIFSKLTIKTPKQRHWCRSGVFIVTFEPISYLWSSVSIVNVEQVNAGWECTHDAERYLGSCQTIAMELFSEKC